MGILITKRRLVSLLLSLTFFTICTKNVIAQDSASVLYVPLIGLTSVPKPLALPNGAGNVTYNYAVKNFLREVALTNVSVVDDKCNPVTFVTGDDNKNSKLDYSETWRYACTTKLFTTTQSTATATGTANNMTATHKAYATVVVGSNNPPPLVSIINITKVAYPLSLPTEGGKITFTYKVNNPGVVPLSDVSVTDDKCNAISGKLGDTNGNNLLDINEVWLYTCTTTLTQTTTNTVNVTAFANGLKAVDNATITVKVDKPIVETIPNFPDAGTNSNLKNTVWIILIIVLMLLVTFYFFSKKTIKRKKRSLKTFLKLMFVLISFVVVVAGGIYFLLVPQPNKAKPENLLSDNAFGWKFPVPDFPSTGTIQDAIAYSDIRDPGGIPQGLPVRLKIPSIGVDTAIEDARITPDGRMDVPAGSVNVAWFALGPHPGRVGSAVIGGHFGMDSGVPKVFYNLNKLKAGDKIYIEDDKNDTLAFIVKSTRLFDRNADATTVFTSQDGLAHLNLITCEGIWNQVNDTYPDRLVVFTDAVASEGAIVVKPKLATEITTPKPAPSPSKMVTLPTSEAREKVTTPSIPFLSPQILIAAVKSFYETPVDSLFTSFLVISIILIAFKIIRR